MGNAERTEPLHIYGPKGVEHIVNSLRVIAPELPFPISYHELTDKEEHFQVGAYMVTAFRVNHNVTCYGYSISIPRAGRFDASRAKELGLPVQLWNPLQKGNEVEYDGKIYTSEMVMGPPRRGLKVTYCTDTRPTREIVNAAAGADIFICEGMYGDDEKDAKAVEHKHMTIREAAAIAREADPKAMWLTHYSPSLNHPEDYLEDAKKIFPRTTMSRDGRTAVLKFSEE
jgi:ribonuclease Z